MLVLLVLANVLLCQANTSEDETSDSDFGSKLVSSLRNDANLDLPVDEEYEDLRAEFLAYHTALSSLTSESRRSMKSTPCWELGGICVEYKLCTGFRFLTEVPGCKDKLNVCCFAWNQYKISDWRHEGLPNLNMPWTDHKDFGGLGILDGSPKIKNKKRRKKKLALDALSVPKLKSLDFGDIDREPLELVEATETAEPQSVWLLLRTK